MSTCITMSAWDRIAVKPAHSPAELFLLETIRTGGRRVRVQRVEARTGMMAAPETPSSLQRLSVSHRFSTASRGSCVCTSSTNDMVCLVS